MREARESRGLSQNAVGVRVGTNGHQIWRYETGSLPGPERLARIAEALEVSVEWLLRGDAAPTAVLDRDDTKGAPAVEAFIEARAELGMPLPEEAIRSLRSTFYRNAPPT
jgi:transcriptional regulator with XRE-family HTH domain